MSGLCRPWIPSTPARRLHQSSNFPLALPCLTESRPAWMANFTSPARATPNSAYSLQTSTDLKVWSPAAAVMVDDQGAFDTLVPMDSGARFYRLALP
jgi:hypothetical protein